MQEIERKFESIGIIGGGPVGSLLSIYLAKHGFNVELYERRPDIRREKSLPGKSINLAVSTRGLYALNKVGLEKEILKQAIPMYGRMIHSISGELTFQRYGLKNTEYINSISRADLNRALLSFAENTRQVNIHFLKKATGMNFETGELHLKDEITGDESHIKHSTVIAADGASSVIRKILMSNPGYHCDQHFLEYGYKELVIPSGPHGKFLIEKNALHIWPRGTFMLIALPNFDGSFTCTLFLPFEGPTSFETLTSNEAVQNFFKKYFPDVTPLISDLPSTFASNPTGKMVTVKCFPWHISDKVLLFGDAAHAIVPFFGQGMNCGFEDCTILNDLLESKQEWPVLFEKFSQLRKPHTDGIADMAVENFTEMRDKVGNARFHLEKSVEAILQKKFPGEYISRYSLVTFSRIPYQVAYKAGLIEDEILMELCDQLNQAEDVNLEKAELLIRSKLSPLLKQQKGLFYGS